MRALVRGIYTNSKNARIIEWGKLITFTGGAQVIVQATGLMCGILIIRLLPTKEYALYTLANTMFATMTILADGGVTTGVMSEGGKVWQDKKQLGAILATGFDLRKKLAIPSFLVAIPILAYLLLHHGSSILMTVLIIISLLPAFMAALSDSIYEVVPKLHQQIRPLQVNQVSVSIGRFLLSATSLFFFPFSFIAILANALPRIYGNLRLRKLASEKASLNESVDYPKKKKIIDIVKLSMPGLIYYCLSAQLNVWLISVFGNTEGIATIGALSRLSMILTMFTSIFAILIVPRFARLPSDKLLVRSAFTKIQLLLVVSCALILIIVWIADAQILWVIGERYAHYRVELLLSMIGSCVVLLVGGTYSLYSTKGWVMHPARSIAVSIVSVITGILLFDVSTLKGVLFLNIYVASIEYVNHLIYSLIKINTIRVHSLNETYNAL